MCIIYCLNSCLLPCSLAAGIAARAARRAAMAAADDEARRARVEAADAAEVDAAGESTIGDKPSRLTQSDLPPISPVCQVWFGLDTPAAASTSALHLHRVIHARSGAGVLF